MASSSSAVCLYIRGYPVGTPIDELKDVVGRFGIINSVRHHEMGFAFFEMSSGGQDALSQLNGKEFPSGSGSTLRVEISTGSKKSGDLSDTLYIRNVEEDVRAEEVSEFFKNYKVTDVTVCNGRPFSFARFDSINEAKRAKEELSGRPIRGNIVRIEFKKAPDARAGPPSSLRRNINDKNKNNFPPKRDRSTRRDGSRDRRHDRRDGSHDRRRRQDHSGSRRHSRRRHRSRS
eukprot:PhM_4_TR4881/c0_g1_i1/m.11022